MQKQIAPIADPIVPIPTRGVQVGRHYYLSSVLIELDAAQFELSALGKHKLLLIDTDSTIVSDRHRRENTDGYVQLLKNRKYKWAFYYDWTRSLSEHHIDSTRTLCSLWHRDVPCTDCLGIVTRIPGQRPTVQILSINDSAIPAKIVNTPVAPGEMVPEYEARYRTFTLYINTTTYSVRKVFNENYTKG